MLVFTSIRSSRYRVTRFYSSSTLRCSPIVELREYQLKPECAAPYLQATNDTMHVRLKYYPLRFFSLPETGGQLHVATHAYYYEGGYQHRDEQRQAMAENDEWKDYIRKTSPYLLKHSSNIYMEAPLLLVREMEGVHGLTKVPTEQTGSSPILELRRYKLKLGYDTVPKFLELYGNGLPSKLEAQGTDPTTSLVTLLYTEVGRLNEVIEIWRHGDGTKAMEQSRVAARGAQEWRKSIASIADLAIEFHTTIHRPTSFSPLK